MASDTGKTRDPRTGRYLPGGFDPPPAGAPHEVSQPVSITGDEIARAHERAEQRAQERAQGGTEGERRPYQDPVRPPPTVLGRVPEPAEPKPEPEPEPVQPLDELTDEFKATHPAASNTDSPSRGIPTPPADPGKQITGGWGPSGGSQEYFALDGSELRTIVLALAGRLKEKLDEDLRFGLSVVYPQVKISLHLTVDGRSPEARELDIKDPAKIELAWDRILTLSAEVEDNEQTPAGQIRDDFQIRGPRKQIVRAGAARMLVDTVHEP